LRVSFSSQFAQKKEEIMHSSERFVRQQRLSLAVTCFVATFALPGFADTDTETGTNGGTGTAGTAQVVTEPNGVEEIVTTPGGPGGSGGAIKSSVDSTDLGNQSQATGGNGGAGGNGAALEFDASAGGNGGNGGTATADLQSDQTYAGQVEENDLATGGNGGNGGNGGSDGRPYDASAPGGEGGIGGSATGSATASGYAQPLGGDDYLQVIAAYQAGTGGNGGNGGTGGNGGSGGQAALITVDANSTGEPVYVQLSVTGGNGGNAGSGGSPTGGSGGFAGFATVSMNNTAQGGVATASVIFTGGAGGEGLNGGTGESEGIDTTSLNDSADNLSVSQEVVGGAGGAATIGGTAGAAGTANSTLDITSLSAPDPVIATASLTATAAGGAGGEGISTSATSGASGTASVTLAPSYGNVNAYAYGYGGDGGNTAGAGTGFVPGNGGEGIASVVVQNTEDYTGYGYSYAVGGNGGYQTNDDLGNGGNGGTAIASVSGSGGESTVYALARGGLGGTGVGSGYSGGNGGVASLGTVTSDSAGLNSPGIIGLAEGGDGGDGVSGASGGTGASETLTNALSYSSSLEFISLDQYALGGIGGYSSGGTPGTAGSATSTMNYTISNNAYATVIAGAVGGSGGDGQNVNAGPGANATATSNLASDQGIAAISYANVVFSEDVTTDFATLFTTEEGSGGYIVSGSNGFTAGTGGNGTATATATVSAATNPYDDIGSTADAVAYGQTGGGVINPILGNGGQGGVGTATATASGTGTAPISVYATSVAYGGTGGQGIGPSFHAGAGGNAIATAIANDTIAASTLQASAIAYGGQTGAFVDGASPGSEGSATAIATVNGSTVQQVVGYGGTAEIWMSQTYPSLPVIGIGNPIYGPTPNINNIGSITVTGAESSINQFSGVGSLTIGDGIHSTILQLAQNSGASNEGSLTIMPGSALDILNNSFIINFTGPDPIAQIRQYINSGYNGGAWNGSGIISTLAQTNPNYGVGWADGADGVVAGLSSGQIETKYTLLGDANLDGVVNGSDFSILAANFGTGARNWDQGNFLFSSSVNGSDFAALAANFGQGDSGAGVAVSQTDIAALDSFAIANGLPLPTIAAVPEPACMGLMAMAGLGALGRRRRR
jgi:hypothetical protein